ncbi:MAG: hypothetical protein ACUVR2_08640 [Anaerolineae bacterium]
MRIYLTAGLCLALLLTSGCQLIFRTPTPIPTPVGSPTVTPVAATATPYPSATATATSTPSPSPSPTPEPSRRVDLGVPVGDTYGIRATVVDHMRGLLYVLGMDGDASTGQGVLTVVDLNRTQVRASVPLPAAFIEIPQVALSNDGMRLYIVDRGGSEGNRLLVVSTGIGAEALGTVLSSVADVNAMALDAGTERLYVASEGELRRLHARTLAEEARTDLPDAAPAFSISWLTVNHDADLLYATGPGSEAIAVYHLEDLRPEAGIALGGRVQTILSTPHRDQTYVLIEPSQPTIPKRVALIQGARLSAQYWEAEPGWEIGQIVLDRDSGNLLLLEDSEVEQPQSRMRVLEIGSEQVVESVNTPYLNWTFAGYPRVAFTHRGLLYSWRQGEAANETLAVIHMPTGEPVMPIHLGIRLVNAALDDTMGRLFVLDSSGAVCVLDTSTLNVLSIWPGVLSPGFDAIRRAPMLAANGQLYVADFARDATLVLDAATGALVAAIPKAGQIAIDVPRNHIFITQQGVYIVDSITYQITHAIPDTVRMDPLLVVPGAIESHYDPSHDLLFVIMSNNSPGSSASTWLQIYDGATLQRTDRPIRAYQQFVRGLAVNGKLDRIWVASAFPGTDLAAYTSYGDLITHFQGLGGPLFLDAAQGWLYVVDWGGLVTVEAATGNVIGYQSLNLTYAPFAAFSAAQHRLYTCAADSADVLASIPGQMTVPEVEEVDVLPLHPVQQLVISSDGMVLAVSQADSGSVLGLLRRDGRGWLLVKRALPTIGRPVVLAAPGVSGTFFAFSGEFWQPYGLFRSQDGGRTWQPSMNGLTDLRVRGMALSPNFHQDGTALLIAGDSGIFRTYDAAQSWIHLSPIAATHIAMALTSAGTPTFLALAEGKEQAAQTIIYAPSERTGNIQRIGVLPIPAYLIKGLALSPHFARDGTAFMAADQYGLLRSTNGGRSWEQVGPTLNHSIQACHFFFPPGTAEQQMVYVLVVKGLYGAGEARMLLRSSDNGQNWQEAINLDARICALALAPDGQVWAGDIYGRVAPLDPIHLMWQPAPVHTPIATLPPAPTPSLFPTP